MRTITHLRDIADQLQGRHGMMQSAACEPALIGRQLVECAEAISPFRLSNFMPLVDCPYVAGEAAQHIETRTPLPGKALGAAVNDGRVGLYRHSLWTHANKLNARDIAVDVVFLQLAPPGPDGLFRLGPSCDVMVEALAHDPLTIAVINPTFPFLPGSPVIHAEQIDYLLHDTAAIGILPPAAVDDVDRAVADNVMSHLEDGIALEVGIGAVPEAVIARAQNLRGITAHMGLVNDAVLNLLDSGALSCEGTITGTLAAGSQDFYRRLHQEPRLILRSALKTNSVERIARLDRFHAVNGALQVDLFGNVNGERLGKRIVSCPGGLADFAAGAQKSAGGKSIIALRSRARGRAHPTIVPVLDSDQPTLAGDGVDFVVTEYGIAEISGASREERRKAMIAIAHPEDRPHLAMQPSNG